MSDQRMSSGPSQTAVMAMLQRSRWWSKIAHHQGLADAVAVRQASEVPAPPRIAPSQVLVRAALSFSVPPDTLAAEERAALEPRVVDPGAIRWTLSSGARRHILESVPFDELLACLPDLDEPDRRVIGPILHGDAQALEQAGEDDLARWLQAVRWFADIVPGLPAPARIFQLLQRRRIRGRLGRIAGGDFVGRAYELRWRQARLNGRAFVIQHPGGQRKRVAYTRNTITFSDDRVVQYLSDTQGGSSGSPVIDEAGRVIALHHAGGRPQEVIGQPPLKKNEGIAIERVLSGLRQHQIAL